MPVGFPNLPSVDADDVPLDLWALEFSKFDIAHAIAPRPGGRAMGAGVTIVHTDTGYSEHPELAQTAVGPPVDTPVLRNDARTFTSPGASMLDMDRMREAARQSQLPQGVRVVNDGQVSAGATPVIQFPNDGVDPLYGAFHSHGTSTASLIMSREGMPDPSVHPAYVPAAIAATSALKNDPTPPKPITGAAPRAQLLPIRVADSVLVDPIVANNMCTAFTHIIQLARSNPEVGVVSISMGWPLGGMPLDFTAMGNLLALIANEGVIVCAAAAQTAVLSGFNPVLETYADVMDGVNSAADAAGDTVEDFSDVMTATRVFATLFELNLAPQSSWTGLVQEIRAQATAAGDTADDIEAKFRTVQNRTRQHSDMARFIGGPGYPGTDPNTICCAACDIRGDEMADGLYGNRVTITAPGQNMYSAKATLLNNAPAYFTHNSGGTSYSTAITAGACALWQAHHGRANLLATYGAPFMIHLFKLILKKSSAQTAHHASDAWDASRRGYGILDAEALLNEALPTSTQTLITDMRSEGIISEQDEAILRDKASQIGK